MHTRSVIRWHPCPGYNEVMESLLSYEIYADTVQLVVFYALAGVWLCALLYHMRTVGMCSSIFMWFAIGSVIGAPIMFFETIGQSEHIPCPAGILVPGAILMYFMFLILSIFPFGGFGLAIGLFAKHFEKPTITNSPDQLETQFKTDEPVHENLLRVLNQAGKLAMASSILIWITVALVVHAGLV